MATRSLERETLLGFSVAVSLLLLVSAVALLAVRNSGQSADWIAHTYAVIGELEGVDGALSSAEAARAAYLATTEPFFLEARDEAISKLQTHLQTAKALTVDNPWQQQRLRELDAQIARGNAQIDDLIVIAQTGGLQAAQRGLAQEHVRQTTREATTRISQMETAEQTLLAQRVRANERSSRLLIAAFAALVLTVATVLGWLYAHIRAHTRQRALQSTQLGLANRQLEAANRELESFSYSVSHDLRAPLRAIDGYAMMLEEDFADKLDDTGRRYIKVVREGSQRMAALIDDLLTFSRLGRQSLSCVSVDMTGLARRAAQETLDGSSGSNPTIKIDELPHAQGDPALLRQVWLNLIGNAVKYSAKTRAPEVLVRATRTDSDVRYEVRDNGVGFDMKYADKLFGVFQRLHAQDEYPGTGVGLAIVQRIVTRHQGAVSAYGESGKGATFAFTLPVEPAK